MDENTTTIKGNREIPRTFSQRLKHYRQLRNLTYKQLGEMAKIDAGYINKLEKGIRRAPSYPIIEKLSKALQINIRDLIDIDPIYEGLPRKSIQEMLYNEYLIRGKLPKMEARESFLALIQILLDSEWKEVSKHKETIEIINKVEIFLKALN